MSRDIGEIKTKTIAVFLVFQSYIEEINTKTIAVFLVFQSHPGRGMAFSEKSAACGRIVYDVKISAKELVRFKSYDLTEMTSQILKQGHMELDFDQIRNMYR